MEPAEAMFNVSVLLGPAISGGVAVVLVRLVRAKRLSKVRAGLYFLAAVVVGLIACEFYVVANSHLITGDGALVVIAAPVTSAILISPVALIFAICLAIVARKGTERELGPTVKSDAALDEEP